jgi:hypothetical protein
MTESTKQYTLGESIEEEIAGAQLMWARRHRGKASIEEAIATQIQRTQVTVDVQPGGRALIYVECFGKKPHTKFTTYNRYQRIPNSGYVRVYHRNM